jgi:hypothetical protein
MARKRSSSKKSSSHHVFEWVAAGTVGVLLVAAVFASSTGALNVSPPGLLSGGV